MLFMILYNPVFSRYNCGIYIRKEAFECQVIRVQSRVYIKNNLP